MKHNKSNIKIPRSFKRFVSAPEGERSPFIKLFSDRKLKKGLGDDTYIRAARLLADGFSAKNYSGKRKREKVKQAKKILDDFYDAATQHGKAKIIRPRKYNRKVYAKELEVSPRLKFYPMAVFNDSDEYKVVKRGKKRKLKLSGEFLDSELFEFPNMKLAAKNPVQECNKLLAKINRKYGHVTHDYKVKCGAYLSNLQTNKHEPNDIQDEVITETITEWFEKYKPESGKWLRGIQVTTFKKQESETMARLRRRGKYHEQKKSRKSKEARKHDKRKGR